MTKRKTKIRKTAPRKNRPGAFGLLPAGLFYASFFICQTVLAATEHGALDSENAGHKSAGLPQFDPSTFATQLFWLALAFAFLYIFFSSKTLPEISGVLENRRLHIQSDIDAAEKLKQEAEKAQAAYDSKMDKARTEAAKTMADITETMKADTRERLTAFHEKAGHEISALETNLETARQNALEDMNTIAAEIASEAARKIVGISTDLNQARTVVQALKRREAA